jgi:Holliday junction resolvase RusA-like endonuclease
MDTNQKNVTDMLQTANARSKATIASVINTVQAVRWKHVAFVIPVVPEPSHRPRLNKNRIYVPGAAKHQRYFDRVIRPTLNGLFISTPCKISTDIYIPTPKSFTFVQRVLAEMKILRPWVNCGDVDNFEKALYDQIQPNEHRGHVGIMANDSLIIDADTHKYYSQTPRYEVKISYMGKMPPELKKILRIRDF